MDVQLQELIDKIKKDGVESAESSAAAIIAEAEKKAALVVSDGEAKAAELIQKAKAECDRMEKASIAAIRQAGRNLLISFRDGVTAELSAVISAETAKVYDAQMLKTLVPEVVKAWVQNTGADSIAVLLSEKDLGAVRSGLLAGLNDQISKGLEIKSDPSLSAGFRIGVKDGSAYYDFSAESVAELFSAYLNPKVAEIMKSAAQDGGNA